MYRKRPKKFTQALHTVTNTITSAPGCLRIDLGYTDKAPPEWCPFNWYHKRQVCWCMPGYASESLYDGSIRKRWVIFHYYYLYCSCYFSACPSNKNIFVVPRFITYEQWDSLRNPTTPPNETTAGEFSAGNSQNLWQVWRLHRDDDLSKWRKFTIIKTGKGENEQHMRLLSGEYLFDVVDDED